MNWFRHHGEDLVGWTASCLKATVLLWVILALASVFLISPNTDEAWILLALRSFLEPPVADYSIDPVPTSGGPFLLANLLLESLFGGRVWVHRLSSLASFLGLLGLILWRADRRSPLTGGLLAVAPLLGLLGTMEVGTMAIGTSTGVLLFFLASLIWCRSASPGIGRAIASGLLFGLAAASRFDLILFAPALLIVAGLRLGDGAGRPRLPMAAIGVASIAAIVLLANNILILGYLNNFDATKMQLPFYVRATGIAGIGFDYPGLLNKMSMAFQSYPAALLFIASVAGVWLALGDEAPDSRERARLAAFLLLVGWILWIGWLFRAPGYIYRYLWTSLTCFSIIGGLGLAGLFQRAGRAGQTGLALGCQVIALGLVLGGIGGGVRSVLLGDGDTLYAESGRIMGLDYFRRFQAIQDHRRAIAYLRDEIPRDATVMTYPGGAWHTLRYEARRPVVLAGGPRPRSDGAARGLYFVLTPEVGLIWHQRPKDYVWFAERARLVAQFGRYSFYELPEGLPEDFAQISTSYVGHPGSRPWFGRAGGW